MTTFKDDDLVEIIRLTDQDKRSSRDIAQLYGCGKSTIGDFLRKDTYTEFWEAYDAKPTAGGNIHNQRDVRKSLKGKKFVFTSAQNNTFVHDKFLKSLLGYCDHNDAELIIGTYHYNKKGYQKGAEEGHWFDPKIRDYILDESREIASGLIWCGELNILPTAVNPASGLNNYTNRDSGIIPHAKLQLMPLPSGNNLQSRALYTTGTVTQRNYVDMKAGQKAEHHHSFSALVVEIDSEGDWFVRQLSSEKHTGCFYDLSEFYTPDGCDETTHTVEAINWGDIHAAKLDEAVAKVSWRDKASILDTLKPKQVFMHDTHDHSSRNHHNIKDPYFLYKMFISDKESVQDEIKLTVSILDEMKRPDMKVVVVESNHDLALEKWLKEQDYRVDPVNAEFFLEMQLATYKAIKSGVDFSIFEHACNTVSDTMDEITFLKTDESYLICGDIECGNHGHTGNNGARGSAKAFQAQGIRCNLGHTHTPAIIDGVWTAGVSGKLKMGYNTGGSSWQQGHIITYKNGKRTIITLKNGKWRA